MALSTERTSSADKAPSLDLNLCLDTVEIWSAKAFRRSPFNSFEVSLGYMRVALLVIGTT